MKTVLEERLSGACDDVIHETCIREGRCLLSLDLDFAHIIRFPPDETEGIAVRCGNKRDNLLDDEA